MTRHGGQAVPPVERCRAAWTGALGRRTGRALHKNRYRNHDEHGRGPVGGPGHPPGGGTGRERQPAPVSHGAPFRARRSLCGTEFAAMRKSACWRRREHGGEVERHGSGVARFRAGRPGAHPSQVVAAEVAACCDVGVDAFCEAQFFREPGVPVRGGPGLVPSMAAASVRAVFHWAGSFGMARPAEYSHRAFAIGTLFSCHHAFP